MINAKQLSRMMMLMNQIIPAAINTCLQQTLTNTKMNSLHVVAVLDFAHNGLGLKKLTNM